MFLWWAERKAQRSSENLPAYDIEILLHSTLQFLVMRENSNANNM